MRPTDAYALALALLGAWGVYAGRMTHKQTRVRPGWRWRILLVELFFIASCFLSSAALALGWFEAWMLVPVGASFLGMIPLPCYFEWVDRIGWLGALRNLLFLVIALFCLGVGVGLLPLWLITLGD
jgi:hypothetical protein